MSGEKFITSSTEGADKEVTPAAARALLGSSGRDFATVAEAEAATYTEPEHCFVKETGKAYIYNASSAATVDNDYVLSVGDAVGRLIATHIAIKSLLDNSIADTLHRHSELVASDGSPDPALSVDSNGIVTIQSLSASMKIIGSSSGYTNAHIAFVATNGINQRGLGTYYYDTNSDTEWFVGRPYVGSDSFAINRVNGLAEYGGVAAAKSNALFLIDNAGNLGLGLTGPTAKAHVRGLTANSSTFIAKNEDSTGKLLESLRADGLKFHDGAIARPALTITADVTLTVATRAFLILNFAAAGGVVTFPASPGDGQEFHPENIGPFAVTFARNGKLINGAASNVSISSQGNGYYKYDTASGSWWNFD